MTTFALPIKREEVVAAAWRAYRQLDDAIYPEDNRPAREVHVRHADPARCALFDCVKLMQNPQTDDTALLQAVSEALASGGASLRIDAARGRFTATLDVVLDPEEGAETRWLVGSSLKDVLRQAVEALGISSVGERPEIEDVA